MRRRRRRRRRRRKKRKNRKEEFKGEKKKKALRESEVKSLKGNFVKESKFFRPTKMSDIFSLRNKIK